MNNSGENILKLCQRDWEYLTPSLKKFEAHSPQELKAIIFISQMYVKSLRKMNLEWIKLRLMYHFLFHPIPSWKFTRELDVEEEKRR